MATPTHSRVARLDAVIDDVRRSAADVGSLELIVRRPEVDQREVLEQGELDVEQGLVGDRWYERWLRRSDRSKDSGMETQVTFINARFVAALAGDPERRKLAGDQLVVDLDLSRENLPLGTRIAVGNAVLEVTARPHTGCNKFSARFGDDALAFVNTPEGTQLRLRGMYARVRTGGTVGVGDVVRKLAPAADANAG